MRLLALDVGLLQAGASMKGEFEKRLRQVIDEVQASPSPIILFIDEAHTLIGAGGAAGTGDAANLLKPALARGTLRTIAATTWAEYKKHIEKDPALTRRFQVVQVDEPDEERCVRMMRELASTLEKHHRVQLLDEAIEAAVRLSHRYIPARQLPDKAVSVLDTACARVAVSQHSTPAALEDCQRRIESLETELEIIEREASVGIDTADARAPRPGAARAGAGAQGGAGGALRRGEGAGRCDPGAAPAAARRGGRADRGSGAARTTALRRPSPPIARRSSPSCRSCRPSSRSCRATTPLILPSVDEQAVASVVGDWTGIPVGRMVKDEIDAVLRLEDDAQAAGDRPGPRAGDDRQAHPDRARRARQPDQADRRVPAVRARPASARPRPRWRWPSCSTAASTTSSPST